MTRIKNPIFLASVLLCLILAAFTGYTLSFRGLILRNVYISDIDVSGLTPTLAEKKIKRAFESNPNQIVFVVNGNEIDQLNNLDTARDYRWVSNQAYKVGRSGNVVLDLKERVDLFFKPKKLTVPLIFEVKSLDEVVDNLENQLAIEPIWPKIVKKSETYEVVEGIDGRTINKELIKKEIREKLTLTGKQIINIEVLPIKTNTNKEKTEASLNILKNWKDNNLSIRYKDFKKILKEEDILPLLGLRDEVIDSEAFAVLVKEIQENIETEPVNAVFEFVDGRVKEFKPEVIGAKVDLPKFEELFVEALTLEDKRNFEVPVILSYPDIRAEDINNMGIKELIGVGTSEFGHSIPGRVFNVNLAASRINGVIVPPGEEFSFNNSVGQISRQTGYQTAYVISEGRTVLGDGGGVCQVSTTVFRAAMNFGFPITERKSHAYRVGYYEQDSPPGIDATIFSPSTDFKFLNDTGHHILIQTKVDTKNLKMKVEIYGTSDGRVASISKPVISNQSAAPATVYVDDPTLPKGTKKQIDWSAPGARVSFDYKVERGGEALFEKKFVSNYQPWRAVYLVGTGN